MTTGDLNQLTISGHVEREPELHRAPDGACICEFVLVHTIELPDCPHLELQFYSVAIYGPPGESFAACYQPDQQVVVTGRLDSPAVDTDGRRPSRVWIVANSIITTHPGQDR